MSEGPARKARTVNHFRWDKDASAILCAACEGKGDAGGDLCASCNEESGGVQLARWGGRARHPRLARLLLYKAACTATVSQRTVTVVSQW